MMSELTPTWRLDLERARHELQKVEPAEGASPENSDVAYDVDDVRRLHLGAVREPGTLPERGASSAELAELATDLGTRLPPALSAWLSICRGEAIGAGGVFGCRPDLPFLDIAHVLALHPTWRGRGWIPVAGDGCGNTFVLTEDGSVSFVDAVEGENQLHHAVAGDLWHFLHAYLRDDQAT